MKKPLRLLASGYSNGGTAVAESKSEAVAIFGVTFRFVTECRHGIDVQVSRPARQTALPISGAAFLWIGT
jgi:hypothetical protein